MLISVMRLKEALPLQVHLTEMAMLAARECRVLQMNPENVAQSCVPKDTSFQGLIQLRF